MQGFPSRLSAASEARVHCLLAESVLRSLIRGRYLVLTADIIADIGGISPLRGLAHLPTDIS